VAEGPRTPLKLLAIGVGLILIVGTILVLRTRGSDEEAQPTPWRVDVPCEGEHVPAGSDLPTVIATGDEGQSFCLGEGVHRIDAPILLRSGQAISGRDGTIIKGSKLISEDLIGRDGDYWTIEEQTQELPPFAVPEEYATCRAPDQPPDYSACVYPDQVFLDGVPLFEVGSIEELSSDEFYFDRGADRIYLDEDPTGKQLEVSVITSAFTGDADDVFIGGLVIEQFANSFQAGAVGTVEGDSWTVRNNEIRFNNGIGIFAASNGEVTGNFIHHNGQMGVAGQGENILVEGNEIAFNNIAGANWAWEGGGTKFVDTDSLVVRDNYSHDNYGPGFWTDIDNINTLYEGNRVEDNLTQGIIHEISYDAVIRDNRVSGNGFGHPAVETHWGGGIEVWSSPNVEIYDNIVSANAHGIVASTSPRGEGKYGLRETTNLFVHDNQIEIDNPTGRTGFVAYDGSGDEYYTSKNNRFEENVYILHDPETGPHFTWIDGYATAGTWQSYGNDVDGKFSST
jgi:parallel beta-helix repeat protein